ncbi:hypothetical protein EV401DRAFT_1916669 [Pisolithus croceorrhizus]|nr:hypothetical protein EV401DRAFT_1916669 [Pisolithus croceorrhizus]
MHVFPTSRRLNIPNMSCGRDATCTTALESTNLLIASSHSWLRLGSRCSLVVDPSIDMSQLAIVTLSGCHCLRSLSLDPTVAMDTDAAFIAQAPLAWSNIEDLSLRGWQRCESHRAKLEGKSPEMHSSSPEKLHPTWVLVLGLVHGGIIDAPRPRLSISIRLCITAPRVETTDTAITSGSRHPRTRSLRTAAINAVICCLP